MKVLGVLAAILGMTPAFVPDDEQGGEKAKLYVFFSERSTGAAETAKAARAFAKAHPGVITLRPALLVEDWAGIGKVTEETPLYRTVRALGEGVTIQIYDPEALGLVGAWKITRLPAVALVRNGKAHVVQGSGTDFEALWRCMR